MMGHNLLLQDYASAGINARTGFQISWPDNILAASRLGYKQLQLYHTHNDFEYEAMLPPKTPRSWLSYLMGQPIQ